MQDANTTDTTLTPGQSAVGTGISLVASATTGINGGSGFLSTDVGRFVFLSGGYACLLYTSPSPRDGLLSRMPSSA